MEFKPGNQLWRLRQNVNQMKKYKTPEEIWAKAVEYFQWCEDNPIIDKKVTAHQGEQLVLEIPKLRPYTLGGLYLMMEITENTWATYRKDEALADICNTVDMVIRNQKFEGAAVEIFNQLIIARDLGLSEKSEVTASVAQYAVSGEPISSTEEWLSEHSPK